MDRSDYRQLKAIGLQFVGDRGPKVIGDHSVKRADEHTVR
jgi:hypothetical protein